MKRCMTWCKNEFLRVLPAFLFFLVSFYLINMTQGLMLKNKGISPYSFATIFVAAAVVAKVLLIVDNSSFVNIFPERPLVYNILWQTFLYGFVVFVVRVLERYIRFSIKSGSFVSGYHDLFTNIDWPTFCAIQLWYFMLFFVFVNLREFVQIIGVDKVRQIFFEKE